MLSNTVLNQLPSRIKRSSAGGQQQLSNVDAASFKVHKMKLNGDSFYSVIDTAMIGSSSKHKTGSLKKELVNYIDNNSEKLSKLDVFQKANGVANVRRTIETPEHWNCETGELIARMGAQALGCELRILQPNTNNGQQYSEVARIPPYTNATRAR